jgi:predicted peroxiredoxin
MAGRFCVSLTRAKDDADRATVAFVVANAAAASGKETLVFLSIEGVLLSQAGYADGVHEPGFSPLKDLIEGFVKAGGAIYVCSPCFQKRRLEESRLVPGAVVVGGAKLVEFEFLGEGAPSVSY